MLLSSSASSFATTRSNHRTNSLQSPASNPVAVTSRLPFIQLPRGGTASSQLSASVESPVTVSSENLAILSERGRKAVTSLIENDVNGSQKHVYSNWPAPGTQDDDKRRLAEQVRARLVRKNYWCC